MKPTLRLGFTDTFGTAINFFTDVLGLRYEIIRDDVNPDYLIFGDANFGQSNRNYTNCKRIFYTGENVRPDQYQYDFALSFDFDERATHYRLPLYVLEMKMMTYEKVTDDYMWLVNERPKIDWEKEWGAKSGICSYLQGNPNCAVRTKFVEFVMSKKKVYCGGRHFNNIGYQVPREIHATLGFLSKCRFNIAFENGSYPGYTTEKLLNAFYAKTLPIYWGNPDIAIDFNTKAFINCHECTGFQDVLDKVDAIRFDKNKWIDIMSQPVFVKPNKYTDLNAFLDWWEKTVV